MGEQIPHDRENGTHNRRCPDYRSPSNGTPYPPTTPTSARPAIFDGVLIWQTGLLMRLFARHCSSKSQKTAWVEPLREQSSTSSSKYVWTTSELTSSTPTSNVAVSLKGMRLMSS